MDNFEKVSAVTSEKDNKVRPQYKNSYTDLQVLSLSLIYMLKRE